MTLHTIEPVWDKNSKVLILGSFPSVKSREEGFYYGHKQNRFWKVIASVCNCSVPENIQDKKKMLLSNGIAVWDVVHSCDIVGSSDSSIKNVVPNDIGIIIENSKVEHIFTNGKKADELYSKYIEQSVGITAVCLPSTSPANAVWTLEKLCTEWQQIKK